MSLHNKPEYNTPEIVAALKQHGLDVGTPSQLSDTFRLGWLASLEAALAAQPEQQQGLVAASPAAAADTVPLADYQALQRLVTSQGIRLMDAEDGAGAAAGVPSGMFQIHPKLVDELVYRIRSAGSLAFAKDNALAMLAASPVAPVGAPTDRLSNQQVRKLMQVAHKWAGPDENDSRSDILEMALRELRFVRQGCELATDATKQLGEHSVHPAATPIDQDFRRRPASSEAAPSAEEPGELKRLRTALSDIEAACNCSPYRNMNSWDATLAQLIHHHARLLPGEKT